jgi:hypothetical protein
MSFLGFPSDSLATLICIFVYFLFDLKFLSVDNGGYAHIGTGNYLPVAEK